MATLAFLLNQEVISSDERGVPAGNWFVTTWDLLRGTLFFNLAAHRKSSTGDRLAKWGITYALPTLQHRTRNYRLFFKCSETAEI